MDELGRDPKPVVVKIYRKYVRIVFNFLRLNNCLIHAKKGFGVFRRYFPYTVIKLNLCRKPYVPFFLFIIYEKWFLERRLFTFYILDYFN